MKKRLLAMVLGIITVAATGQTRTIQERLGYPKDTKLLIIHADDIGVSHAENMATIYAMEKGSVNSGSIMVPCPWFMEIASYASSHPATDFGLHLTLTSEWPLYKWGPVTAHSLVPGLLTDKGFFNNNNEAVRKNATPHEVEKELRSQIERAIKFGIDPTHFDTHMFCGVSDPRFVPVLLKLGREYKVPVLLNPKAIKQWIDIDLTPHITDKDVVVDQLFMAFPEDYAKGMDNFYTSALKSVKPGLSCILMHAAYNDEEMRGVTGGHSGYGAGWRQDDFNFFTSEKCKKLIESENIKLITWREIRDKLMR
jgi:chitin disaccharide deacetylase